MRKSTTLSLLSMVVLTFALPAAAAWNLAPPCPGERQADYEAYRQRLLTAEPGSPSYLPHPFPNTDQEVFEDLIYTMRRGARDPLPATDGRLFEAVDSGAATYRVTRVADWSPLHCGRREARPFYHLVQIFDGDTEITRGTVAPSGAPGSVLHWASGGPFKDAPPPLPADPAKLVGDAVDGVPAPRHDFQYVSLWGSVRCDDLTPCVAFRAGPAVYLWWWEPAREASALLRVDTGGKRFSIQQEMGSGRNRHRFLESFHDGPEEVITLGADAMGVAVRLGAEKGAGD